MGEIEAKATAGPSTSLRFAQRLSGFVKAGWWKSRKTEVLFSRFPTTPAAAGLS
jgi:hypothetical protein